MFSCEYLEPLSILTKNNKNTRLLVVVTNKFYYDKLKKFLEYACIHLECKHYKISLSSENPNIQKYPLCRSRCAWLKELWLSLNTGKIIDCKNQRSMLIDVG